MIYCFGSINVDYIYTVPKLPVPGETIAVTALKKGLGGKGANQSVAVARAGSKVCHIGAVGLDGDWAVEELRRLGVTRTAIAQVDAPTGHANILVDPEGENEITIFAGANHNQSLTHLKQGLSDAQPGDILMLQNECNLQVEAARLAQAKGLYVIYSAAPFSADAVDKIAPHLDLLVTNAGEAAQLERHLPCDHIITRGAEGADWVTTGEIIHCPAHFVTPVDTTGAGDCFIGYVAAGLDDGMPRPQAMALGSAAAALQVQRHGTAIAIPQRNEVDALLSSDTS